MAATVRMSHWVRPNRGVELFSTGGWVVTGGLDGGFGANAWWVLGYSRILRFVREGGRDGAVGRPTLPEIGSYFPASNNAMFMAGRELGRDCSVPEKACNVRFAAAEYLSPLGNFPSRTRQIAAMLFPEGRAPSY